MQIIRTMCHGVVMYYSWFDKGLGVVTRILSFNIISAWWTFVPSNLKTWQIINISLSNLLTFRYLTLIIFSGANTKGYWRTFLFFRFMSYSYCSFLLFPCELTIVSLELTIIYGMNSLLFLCTVRLFLYAKCLCGKTKLQDKHADNCIDRNLFCNTLHAFSVYSCQLITTHFETTYINHDTKFVIASTNNNHLDMLIPWKLFFTLTVSK